MAKRFKTGKKASMMLGITVKAVDTDTSSLVCVFSSQKEDRHGDIVMQEGWDLKHYKKNPVILNSHNYDDATEVIGKAVPSSLKVENGQLTGKIIFAVDANPKAKVIFDLYAGGFLSAFSVGFIPKKFKEDDYYVIEEAELLELSAVSVPANAYALAKSKGIQVDDENGEPLVDIDEDEEAEDTTEEPEIDPVDAEEDETTETTDEDADEEPEPEIEAEDQMPEVPAESIEEKAIRLRKELAETEALITKETPAPIQKPVNKKAILLKVINSYSEQRNNSLKTAHVIIQSLLTDDERKEMDPGTREKVEKRKLNQAIRALVKAK